MKVQQAALFATRFNWLSTALSEYQHQKWLEDRQSYVFVPFADCVKDEQIRTVIEDTRRDCAEEAIKAKFNNLLPTVVSHWVDSRRAEITALLLTEWGRQDLTAARAADPLALAIAWLGCVGGWNHDSRSFNAQWPRILDHSHFRRECSPAPAGDPYAAAFRSHFPPADPWWRMRFDGQHCRADKRLAHICDVITACGADPDTATCVQMEESNARLVCRICASLLKREGFDWKAAVNAPGYYPDHCSCLTASPQVYHDFDKHYCRMDSISKPLPGRWERIPDEFAAAAKGLEDTLLAKPFRDYTLFHCAWCARDGLKKSIMKEHVQSW